MLDQLLPVLGYTDVVDTQYIDHRYIGPLRYLQNTDEIQSPYFTAANAAPAGQHHPARPLRQPQHGPVPGDRLVRRRARR